MSDSVVKHVDALIQYDDLYTNTYCHIALITLFNCPFIRERRFTRDARIFVLLKIPLTGLSYILMV